MTGPLVPLLKPLLNPPERMERFRSLHPLPFPKLRQRKKLLKQLRLRKFPSLRKMPKLPRLRRPPGPRVSMKLFSITL